ncbi:MAG: MFS transporter [Akkermansiaceae bacterium]
MVELNSCQSDCARTSECVGNVDHRRGKFGLLWILFFFHGMAPGFWVPTLTNVLNAEGHGQWVAWVFAIPPICALISPVIGGAIADEKVAAQKMMGWSSLAAAVAIGLAYCALDLGFGIGWFLVGIGLYALASGPTWGLVATICFTHLDDRKKQFPLVRLGATFGWMGAGFVTSYLLISDASPISGYAAALTRMIAGLLAFTMPNTPPMGSGKSWKSALGLNSFSLFKNRDHAVLFSVTGLFAVPLAAFYMYAPELFKDLGNKTPTASMALAQWSEVAAMILLGFLMVTFRLKVLLMWALGLSVLRFGLSGYAGFTEVIGWHFAGVALHGVCYTLYFVTAQVYLDRRVPVEMRGQAQGLLSLMASGVGPLIGAFFCGWLRAVCVDENGEGWATFWWVLAGMIAVCWVAFGVLYRGERAGS